MPRLRRILALIAFCCVALSSFEGACDLDHFAASGAAHAAEFKLAEDVDDAGCDHCPFCTGGLALTQSPHVPDSQPFLAMTIRLELPVPESTGLPSFHPPRA